MRQSYLKRFSWLHSSSGFRRLLSSALVSEAQYARHAARSATFLAGAALACAGCAGGSVSPPPSQAVVITTEPVSQVVPITQTATFAVVATGTAPLNYQWSENGVAISGATGASYTTPPVALGANGSTAVGSFQVTVSNSVNSVTTKAVTLTAGARQPKPGDIRYLSAAQVGLPGFWGSAGGQAGNLTSDVYSFANSLGTPLWIGKGCTWNFFAIFLPKPMDNMAMYYQVGHLQYTSAASYLQSAAAPYLVITSMDIQPQAGCEAVGVSWIETAQGGFDQRLEVVSPSQIQAQVAADGQASRIVTAASFDASGNAILISYGWTGDTTTVYETQTYLVAAAQVAAAATTLAADGYFISAFGGNDADGYILVGARVQGDTLPRAMFLSGTLTGTPNTGVGSYGYAYFTPVVYLTDQFANTQVEANEQ